MSFLLGPQVLVGVAAIDVSARFSNGSSIPALATKYGFTARGQRRQRRIGDSTWSFLRHTASWGAVQRRHRVNAPFSLKTLYDDNWIGRFQGIKSDLTTINYHPTVAYKVTETISVGAGVNYQFLQTGITNAVATPVAEGRIAFTAQGGAWGWNLGAIFGVSSDMRIGASCRSMLDYDVKGTVNTIFATNGAPVPSGNFSASADMKLPDNLTTDRYWLAMGVRFRPSEAPAFDVGYATSGFLPRPSITRRPSPGYRRRPLGAPARWTATARISSTSWRYKSPTHS